MYCNHKHLTLSNRIAIESGIYAGHSFQLIAKKIRKHPSTISREIRINRTHFKGERPRGKNCGYAGSCKMKTLCDEEYCSQRCSLCESKDCQTICSRYHDGTHCKKLDKKPYVCNICSQRRSCKSDRAYYSAEQANSSYKTELSGARQGIRISAEKLREIDEILSRLIKKGQPLSHIHANHKKDFGVCQRTLYNYIESGRLKIKNIHLRRKVGYKTRHKVKIKTEDKQICRQGRKYEDYLKYMGGNPRLPVVQMDTVKGIREKGLRLLTLIFCECNLMLMFLMKDGKADSVVQVFDYLSNLFGLDTFKKLFPVILTDNGSEFKKVDELEFTVEGKRRTRVFYCDPQASWQKPHLEKNHEFIRYVIPRGKSLNSYTQDDMKLLMNHINSISRAKLDGKCPYELVVTEEMKKMLNLLDLKIIPADEVHMTPTLLKNKLT